MTFPYIASSTIISPRPAVLLVILLTSILITYWLYLGSVKPRSRRRIRRANTMVLLIQAWTLCYALAAADMELEPVRFIVAWIGVFLLTLLALALASLDSINNIRVFKKERSQRRTDRRAKIKQATARLLPSADHADLNG